MPVKWQGDNYLCFQDVFYKYLQVLWAPLYPTVKRYKIHTSGLTLSWLMVSKQINFLVEQSNNFQSNMLKFSRKLSIHTDTSFVTDSLLCPWGMKALFSKFKPLNMHNLLIRTLLFIFYFNFFSKNIHWQFLTSISVEREIIQLMWKKFIHGNYPMVGFSNRTPWKDMSRKVLKV